MSPSAFIISTRKYNLNKMILRFNIIDSARERIMINQSRDSRMLPLGN